MIKRLFLIIFCLCFVMQTVYAGIVKPVFKQLIGKFKKILGKKGTRFQGKKPIKTKLNKL